MEYAIRDGRWLLIVLFSIVNLLSQPTHARQCYVCGIGPADPLYAVLAKQQGASSTHNASLGHGTSDAAVDPVGSRTCSGFGQDSAENLAKFIVQCPDGYRGCITQWDGDTESRTCNMYLIDDCKVANGVTYCYCNTDRCNGKGRQEIEAAMALTNSLPPKHIPGLMDDDTEDDDEDDDDNGEASGFGSLLTTIDNFSRNDSPPTTSTESTTPMQRTTLPNHNVHVSRNSGKSLRFTMSLGAYFIPLCIYIFF